MGNVLELSRSEKKGDSRSQEPRLFRRHFRGILKIACCPIRVRSEERDGIRSDPLNFLFGVSTEWELPLTKT